MAYEPDHVTACRMVLLEVLRLLEPWRGHLMLIGGWAVQIALDQRADPDIARDYVGTMDVDLDGDIGAAQARAIRGRLIKAGYQEDAEMPDRFIRTVELSGQSYDVPVDLLLGSSAQKRDRRGRAQTLAIEDATSSDGAGHVAANVVSVADLLVMKMRPYRDGNSKWKDAYDVYYLLRYAAVSPEHLAAEVAVALPPELLDELVENLRVFFLMKRRAGRDAGMMIRDHHGVPKADTEKDALNLVQRFVEALER